MTPKWTDAFGGRAVWSCREDAESFIIAGRDARRFCNGMMSNNVRDLAMGEGCRNALLDDRGRIVGFLFVLCEGDDRFVALPEGLSSASFAERYEKYVVFDDVAFEPDARAFVRIGVHGPHAKTVVCDTVGPLDERAFRRAWDGWVWREGDVQGHASFGAVVPCAALADAEKALDRHAVRLSTDEDHTLRVCLGRPRFPQDTGPKGLPHELGLRDELLSFDKGCYLGQESINRIDVLGGVKRTMVGVRGVGRPGEGARLTLNGASPSPLTSVVAFADGRFVALSVVRTELWTSGAQPNVEGATDVALFAVPADPAAVLASD